MNQQDTTDPPDTISRTHRTVRTNGYAPDTAERSRYQQDTQDTIKASDPDTNHIDTRQQGNGPRWAPVNPANNSRSKIILY